MTDAPPFSVHLYHLSCCDLRTLQSLAEARCLSDRLARMDPWRTLRYTSNTLLAYLLRQDTALYRYAVVVPDTTIGVVCVRYPWLRGAYLELIGLEAAYQGLGVGREILRWVEGQARLAVPNVWVLV